MMNKKYIILMLSVLLSLTANAEKRQGNVKLRLTNLGITQKTIDAVAIFDDETRTATLGNGYNACISQYENYCLVIPGTCTDGGVTYSVEIGAMAFRFCNKLMEVSIGEGVKTIGAYAFVGCSSLQSVTLPSTLTTIGSGAFSELASLKTVTSYATNAPTWQWNDLFAALGTKASMASMAAGRTLYVKEGSLASYENTLFDGTETAAGEMVGWKDAFKRIYEFNSNQQTIDNLDELIAFRNAVNNGSLYKNSNAYSVTLTADIDMSTVDNWTPIGMGDKSEDNHFFKGTFNGGGHVIKNLKVEQAQIAGLFGITQDATICNFHLLNPTVLTTTGGFAAGAVCAEAINTRISDVLVTSDADNSSFTVRGPIMAGGIVGVTNLYNSETTTIERCLFRGRICGDYIAGGIVGNSVGNVIVTDCSADRHFEVTQNGEQTAIGGIVGIATYKTTITRCIARNDFESAAKGAIVGSIAKLEDGSISDCVYWENREGLNTFGNSFEATFTQANNDAYPNEETMLGETTSSNLGSGWHYFTGLFKEYPIPTTLVDMYMNNLVLSTTTDGLVFSPHGKLSNFVGYQVVGYTGTAKSLAIPDMFNGKPVTAIGPRAFYGSTIKSFTFGTHLAEIAESAFEECDALETFDLPNSVTYLDKRAFWGCDNLTSFSIGSNLQNFSGNFLAYCHNLQEITSNNSRFRFQDGVLMGSQDNYLELIACLSGKTGDYTLPASEGIDRVNVLGECFEGCTGLTSITFPANKTCWLGNGVFNGANNLRYIDMSRANAIAKGGSTPLNTIDRQDSYDPFYGTSNSTFIFMPESCKATSTEPNVVINSIADHVLLTDDWDFYTPVDITATNGVSYDRKLTAAWTEMTQPTGNKIVMKDENGKEIEVDEYEVTGRTYTPRGYSVCLPYALTLTAENAKVYVPSTVESGDDGNLKVFFNEVTSKQMAAYTPYYIVVSGEDKVNLNTTATTIIARTATAGSWQSDDFQFKGATATISNAALSQTGTPAYILQNDGNWHKAGANVEDDYVPPYRGFFLATAANTADQLVSLLDAIELADAADNSKVISTYGGNTVSVTLQGRTLYKDGSWNTLCLPFSMTEDQVTAQLAPSALMELDTDSEWAMDNGQWITSNNGQHTGFNATDGTLSLFFKTAESIEAGKPYIIKWETTETLSDSEWKNPVFTGVTVVSGSPDDKAVTSKDNGEGKGNISFVGTYGPTDIYSADKTNLYVGADNSLYYPWGEDMTSFRLNAFRAYFKLNNGLTAGESKPGVQSVRAFVLNFGDESSNDAAGITTLLSPARGAEGGAWHSLDGRRLSGKPTNKGLYINNGIKIAIQ